MLNHANDRRSTTASYGTNPSAANMQIVQWDYGLEREAQAWSDLCQFKHGGSSGGQNLAQGYGYTVVQLIDNWWKEYSLYDWSAPGFAAATGHFTQMAWATSNRIGCGISSCPPNTLITCNYLSAGNLGSMAPYVSGRPCSNCPITHPYCVNNLCSPGPADGDSFGSMVIPFSNGSCPNPASASLVVSITGATVASSTVPYVYVAVSLSSQIHYTPTVRSKTPTFTSSFTFYCVPPTATLTFFLLGCSGTACPSSNYLRNTTLYGKLTFPDWTAGSDPTNFTVVGSTEGYIQASFVATVGHSPNYTPRLSVGLLVLLVVCFLLFEFITDQ
uniref:SCP domain-containing protein n=1 Tax=Arcella intermedia TaxID=1963864 RepID=A0A6B2L8U4_9EUKA